MSPEPEKRSDEEIRAAMADLLHAYRDDGTYSCITCGHAETTHHLAAALAASRADNERISAAWAEVIQREQRTENTAAFDIAEARAERDAARVEVSQLRAKIEEARELLAKIVDPDSCWFDHNGDCQAHGWTIPKPGGICGHEQVKRFLAGQPAFATVCDFCGHYAKNHAQEGGCTVVCGGPICACRAFVPGEPLGSTPDQPATEEKPAE